MKITGGLLMVALLLFSFLSPAYAERYVVVNGQRLSIPEIQYVEQLHCGPIPNGRYWINLHGHVGLCRHSPASGTHRR